MSLYWQIKELYPNISDSDFVIQNEGEGAYIKKWKSSYPKPTKAELNAVQAIATEKLKWKEIREKRNILLSKYDWMIIRHVTQIALGITPKLTAGQYTILLTYMQELRDIPQVYTTIDSVKFPILSL